MAEVRQAALILLTVAVLCAAGGPAPKFYPDDPLQVIPAPLPVGKIAPQEVNDVLDFLNESRSLKPKSTHPAGAVNTLGEVPDSEWFTNRHRVRRLTREELQRGYPTADAPTAPYTVTGGKSEGITPGFRMKDSRGKHYFVKVDPIDFPELATSPDVIVSKLLYAIGYNTPKNEIVQMIRSDLQVSADAKLSLADGRTRHMTAYDVDQIVRRIPHYPDHSFRVLASLAIPGDNVGPFRFEDVRQDDPNDVVPHQDRRDLRGLYVFSAWFNNTDVRANNSLDTIVEENGLRFIRHYLLDFGSSLGSDGLAPQEPRWGHRFVAPTLSEALERIATLGLMPDPWEREQFPNLPAVGSFESRLFEPDHWRSEFPNPALMSRRPDDDYWAAKQVMAFTDDDIRTIVETAKFTDKRTTQYIARTLSERRDKIGRSFFSKVLPLDNFHIENDTLRFDDLSVQYGFHAPRKFAVQWSTFDNLRNTHIPIPNTTSLHLPASAIAALPRGYFCAVISAVDDSLKPVTVYFRKEGQNYKVVGIDRTW